MEALHSDFLVVAGGGEHAGVGGVPGDGADAAAVAGMAFEGFDEGGVFFVPDVDTAICAVG